MPLSITLFYSRWLECINDQFLYVYESGQKSQFDARFSEKTGVTVMFSTDTIEPTIVIKQ